MHVDFFEAGGIENFSVGDAIESHAAGKADGLQAGFFGELAQHAEINLFEASLKRRGQIFVALLERFVRTAHRAEVPRHFGRKHFAQRGRFVGVGPGHFRAGAMVREVIEAKFETVGARIFVEAHNVAEGREVVAAGRTRQAPSPCIRRQISGSREIA